MKITVLGTAAATSFPLPFCKCSVCDSARLHGGYDLRKRSSIVINNELLIDLGPDCVTSSFLYEVDVSKVKYLLQTHSHADHFDAGIFVTRHKEYATENPTHLKIICSKGTLDDMNVWVKAQAPSYDLLDLQTQIDMNFDYKLIKKNEKIEIDEYEITAIDAHHDSRVEALVYIISYRGFHVLYATDLLFFDDDAWEILAKYRFDVIFIDQTYGQGYNAGGHTDAGTIREYIDRMRNELIIDDNTLIYATHISHEGNDMHEVMEAEAQKYGYHIAFDGMQIEL